MFDGINLPTLPSVPNPLDGLLDELEKDFADTPFGEIASCGSDVDCIADVLGLAEALDFVESVEDKIESIYDRFQTAADTLDDTDPISCAEWSEKSIECSKVFPFLKIEEDCSIDLPHCEKLDLSGFEGVFMELSDVFDDIFTSEGEARRRLELFFDTDDPFTEILDLPLFELSDDVKFFDKEKYVYHVFGEKDNVAVGIEFDVKLYFAIKIGLYRTDCGVWKLAINPELGFDVKIGSRWGYKSQLENVLGVMHWYELAGSGTSGTKGWGAVPYEAAKQCFTNDGNSTSKFSYKCKAGKECKDACDAYKMLYTEDIDEFCSVHEVETLLFYLESSTGWDAADNPHKKAAQRCINFWTKVQTDIPKLVEKSNRLALSSKGYYPELMKKKFNDMMSNMMTPPISVRLVKKEVFEEYKYDGNLQLQLFFGLSDCKQRPLLCVAMCLLVTNVLPCLVGQRIPKRKLEQGFISALIVTIGTGHIRRILLLST